jgi:glycosyltransferase involved in cell wall biosynthesis
MTLRLAVIVSHPIQYFAPWHREVARLKTIDLRVYFCCDWGLNGYTDPQFQTSVKWDIPLLEGYEHEFLAIAGRPERLSFWEVDNPQVARALDRFDPDVLQVFGYAHRTNWRAARWAHDRRKPLMLFSDSNARARSAWWKKAAKQIIVRQFYSGVDGALFVSDSNRAYHINYGLSEDRLFPGVLPIDRARLLAGVQDRSTARRSIRERLGIPQDAFVVMLCGKYSAIKRPLDLVAAAWTAAQKGLPIWSLLVGEGPERAAIEDFCRVEKVSNAVLTGFINQSVIPEYYAASDVVALTSSMEAYGLAASEGASFGLPIVISDQAGCIGQNSTAQPGINAIVYPCGNRELLREAIETLYKDKARYSTMSTASARIAEGQDVTAAANALAAASIELQKLGIR